MKFITKSKLNKANVHHAANIHINEQKECRIKLIELILSGNCLLVYRCLRPKHTLNAVRKSVCSEQARHLFLPQFYHMFRPYPSHLTSVSVTTSF